MIIFREDISYPDCFLDFVTYHELDFYLKQPLFIALEMAKRYLKKEEDEFYKIKIEEGFGYCIYRFDDKEIEILIYHRLPVSNAVEEINVRMGRDEFSLDVMTEVNLEVPIDKNQHIKGIEIW